MSVFIGLTEEAHGTCLANEKTFFHSQSGAINDDLSCASFPALFIFRPLCFTPRAEFHPRCQCPLFSGNELAESPSIFVRRV